MHIVIVYQENIASIKRRMYMFSVIECRGRGETSSVICLFLSGPEESHDHRRPHSSGVRERCGVYEVYFIENKSINST